MINNAARKGTAALREKFVRVSSVIVLLNVVSNPKGKKIRKIVAPFRSVVHKVTAVCQERNVSAKTVYALVPANLKLIAARTRNVARKETAVYRERNANAKIVFAPQLVKIKLNAANRRNVARKATAVLPANNVSAKIVNARVVVLLPQKENLKVVARKATNASARPVTAIRFINKTNVVARRKNAVRLEIVARQDKFANVKTVNVPNNAKKTKFNLAVVVLKNLIAQT